MDEAKQSEWLEETGGAIPFDPLAQDPAHWRFLNERIPEVIVYSAGSNGDHTNIRGLLEGYPFLIQSSPWETEMIVGSPDEFLSSEDILYYSSFNSQLISTPDDMEPAFMSLIAHLDVKPFEYMFRAKLIEGYKDGELILSEQHDDVVYSYGNSPREAYNSAKENAITGLTQAGFTLYSALSLWESRKVEKTPLNEDTRVFPEKRPKFKVVY